MGGTTLGAELRQQIYLGDDAIITAYGTGAYSYREIAEHCQLHLTTVGRIIRARMLPCEN